MHSTFHISCKAVIYNPQHTKVLIPEYQPQKYGLLGGHMEEGETPDEAMRREVKEEIGVNLRHLRRLSFDLVNASLDCKVALVYECELDESTQLIVDHQELRSAVWVPIASIKDGSINVGDYRQFIVA